MVVLSIDPGNKQSAWLLYDGERPLEFGKTPNEEMLVCFYDAIWQANTLAIETLKPRGMPTSFEEMQTQLWAGRFIQAWGGPFEQIFRHNVKMHHCGQARAKDSNIRASLIDRFGGESMAIGGKKCQQCKGKGWAGRSREPCGSCGGSGWLHPPGPLHGIAQDCWSALAIATYWWDRNALEPVTQGELFEGK